jgi:hypothetical protein
MSPKIGSVVFSFCKCDLSHSAVQRLREKTTFPSGALVIKFDGDSFHFCVFSQGIFTSVTIGKGTIHTVHVNSWFLGKCPNS